MGEENERTKADEWQIGFLTEWQMYAQKLEGDSWIGEKMDSGKIEKMSGEYWITGFVMGLGINLCRSTIGSDV